MPKHQIRVVAWENPSHGQMLFSTTVYILLQNIDFPEMKRVSLFVMYCISITSKVIGTL